jgi:cytochrome b561
MGTLWAKSIGKTPEEMKPKNMAMIMGLTILYTLLLTMFLLINVTGPGQDTAPDGHSYHTFGHGLGHAVFLSILIIIPVMGTPALYEEKSKLYFFVQLGYWFVRMAVALGILSAWR